MVLVLPKKDSGCKGKGCITSFHSFVLANTLGKSSQSTSGNCPPEPFEFSCCHRSIALGGTFYFVKTTTLLFSFLRTYFIMAVAQLEKEWECKIYKICNLCI